MVVSNSVADRSLCKRVKQRWQSTTTLCATSIALTSSVARLRGTVLAGSGERSSPEPLKEDAPGHDLDVPLDATGFSLEAHDDTPFHWSVVYERSKLEDHSERPLRDGVEEFSVKRSAFGE